MFLVDFCYLDSVAVFDDLEPINSVAIYLTRFIMFSEMCLIFFV